MKLYTSDELEQARSVDLCMVAERQGYHVVKVGNLHSLKEHDSVRIHNKRTWFRWSNNAGGSTIDFLVHFSGMKFQEAVKYLLDLQGYDPVHVQKEFATQTIAKEDKSKFELPKRCESYRRLYGYLINSRGLSKQTVDFFIQKGIMYESAEKHNIIFLATDKNREVHGAMVHGTYSFGNKSFKGNVKFSDKEYSFHVSNDSTQLHVFEAPIDMMSYMELYGNKDDYISLASVSDREMDLYLKEHPNIQKISFALDHDKKGIGAVQTLSLKYQKLGYQVINESELLLPKGYKDWNDQLKSIRLPSKESKVKVMDR